MTAKITDVGVAKAFQGYPPAYRKKLFKIRELILKTSKSIKQIDELTETLKWGEPSYAPRKRNVGTAVRIHWLKSKPSQCGVYFHCQTNLIQKIKRKFGDKFNYEGKRAIVFGEKDRIPEKELRECITMALTYHLKKK